jgi:hypothetical protein
MTVAVRTVCPVSDFARARNDWLTPHVATINTTIATAIHHFFFDLGRSGVSGATVGGAVAGGGALTGNSVATLCKSLGLDVDTLPPSDPGTFVPQIAAEVKPVEVQALTDTGSHRKSALKSRENPQNPSTGIDAPSAIR